jgi:hypothetical protein
LIFSILTLIPIHIFTYGQIINKEAIMFFIGSGVRCPRDAAIKFTYEKNMVGVWGNASGLKYLADLFTALAENPKEINHIHLDRAVPEDSPLTADSLFAFISVLKEKDK